MDWKLLFLLLLAAEFVYNLTLHVTTYRSANNPIPASVADVYDAETYQRWRAYSGEKCRLQIVSDCITLVITALLLAFDVYAKVATLVSANVYVQLIAVLVFHSVWSTVLDAIFGYVNTMRIEQRYGFNRSTVKTFVLDQIRSLLISLILSIGLMSLLALLYRSLGDWVILLFAIAVFALTLIISFLYPIFSRMGNKFVPLEEGELKERLTALLQKYHYKVKAIEVMDASRRTTKLNAYFTGFGKMKTIVLFDNLLNAMDTDEICAVFAHELGHGLHKDVLKQQVMNLFNLLLMSVLVWLTVKIPAMHTAFGFEAVNYGFSFLLLGIALGVVQPLTGMLSAAYSRHAEYRADRQAAAEGYGKALVTALKKLAKENFVHLSPAPILVVLEYSHPPLHARITALEQLER